MGPKLEQLVRDALERRTPSTGQTWRTFTAIARSVTGASDSSVGERRFRALIDKLVSGADAREVGALHAAHAGADGRVKLSTFGRVMLGLEPAAHNSFVEAHEARQQAAADAQGWTAEQRYDARFAHPWDADRRAADTRAAAPSARGAAAGAAAVTLASGSSRAAWAPAPPASPGGLGGAAADRRAAPERAGAAPAGGGAAADEGGFPAPGGGAISAEQLGGALAVLRTHLAQRARAEVSAGADALYVVDRHSLHLGQREAARQQLALVAALEDAARAGAREAGAAEHGLPPRRAAWAAAAAPGPLPPPPPPPLSAAALRAGLRAIALGAGCARLVSDAPYCHPLVLAELWAVATAADADAAAEPWPGAPAGADGRLLALTAFLYPPLALPPPRAPDAAALFAASAALHRRAPADPAAPHAAFGAGRLADGPFDRASGRAGARYLPPPPRAALPSSVRYRHCATELATPHDLTGELVTASARRPDRALDLAYVYGYNGASKWTRSPNLFLLKPSADDARAAAGGGKASASATLAYSAAGTIVLTDEASRAQRFFRGHDDDVSCVARHPSGALVASGQGGRSGPFLAVWDAGSMAELARVGYVQTKAPVRPGATDDVLRRVPFYQFSICAAAFEPAAGDLLGAVGVDERFHELGLWDWRSGRLLGACQTISADQPGVAAVHALGWAPAHAHGARTSSHVLVVVGCLPMPRFIFAEPGGVGGQWAFASKQGAQPAAAKPKGAAAVGGRQQSCVAFGAARSAFEGLTVTGSDDGALYVWELARMAQTRASEGAAPTPGTVRCASLVAGAHAAGTRVSALVGTVAGFVSGGSDGAVHVWTLAPRAPTPPGSAGGADAGARALVRARSYTLGLDGSSALPLSPPAQLGAAERATPRAPSAAAARLPADARARQADELARQALPGRSAPAPARAPPRRAIRSLDAEVRIRLDDDNGGGGGGGGGRAYAEVSKIFVGTVGGELWRIDGAAATRLVAAHAQRVDAIGAHPTLPLFASAGADARVCVWDARAPTAPPRVWQARAAVTAVCFGQPEGSWLCAGLATGAVATALLAQLATLSEAPAANGGAAALACACAPGGGLLAVARGRVIDIFRVGAGGELGGALARCRGSSSLIRTVDWLRPPSAAALGRVGVRGGAGGGLVVQGSSAARELLFWDARSGTQVSDPFGSGLRAGLLDWHTWTSPIGFPVMGIWPDGANTNSINRLCRSTDGELLVTSDDASHLKLFNHPCIVEDAPFSGPFFAHASHVPAAVFLRGDEHVASAGGSDRTVMLWRVVRTGGEREPDAFGAAPPRRNDPPPANKWRPNGRT